EYAKGAMLNLKRCAGYLAASFIAKTVLCLVAAVMSKIPPASPSALLIWGLLLDLAVSFVSLRRDPPWNISSVDKSTYELQSSYIDFARPAVIGAIWGLLLIAVPAAIITFLPEGHSYRGAGAVTNQVFVAALLSVPVVGGEMMTNGSIFKRSKRRSRAIPALFLLSLVLSLLFAFFKGVAATVAANVISFKLYLVTFVPAVLFLIVFETIKIIERKKKKPEDTSAGNGEKS
ncbi:MAG: hypothetical protein IKN50_06210, partial [Clostridia bacterium]|nr:hypothetical protein [Clostridia bacterium]